VQLRSVISDVRRIVDNLRPPILDDLGLAEALVQLARRFDSPAMTVAVRVGHLPRLSAAVEVAVLRIAGEALTNVARHSGAAQCAVTLGCEERLLVLTIDDDGRGLPPEGTSDGLGLTSMRQRALELGGACTVEVSLTGGTAVRALLPLVTDTVSV
jgi:signal transduction histidine kinase